MRKLNVKEFAGGTHHHQLVEFVNENSIKETDILKIMNGPFNYMLLFYYTEK